MKMVLRRSLLMIILAGLFVTAPVFSVGWGWNDLGEAHAKGGKGGSDDDDDDDSGKGGGGNSGKGGDDDDDDDSGRGGDDDDDDDSGRGGDDDDDDDSGRGGDDDDDDDSGKGGDDDDDDDSGKGGDDDDDDDSGRGGDDDDDDSGRGGNSGSGNGHGNGGGKPSNAKSDKAAASSQSDTLFRRNAISIGFRDGTSEKIIGNRYERFDSKGRKLESRAARQGDWQRLEKLRKSLNNGQGRRLALETAAVVNAGQKALQSTDRAGWTESLIGDRYILTDPQGNVVTRRKAQAKDIQRLKKALGL